MLNILLFTQLLQFLISVEQKRRYFTARPSSSFPYNEIG